MERKFHREKKTIELIETLVECIEFWSKLCANGKFFLLWNFSSIYLFLCRKSIELAVFRPLGEMSLETQKLHHFPPEFKLKPHCFRKFLKKKSIKMGIGGLYKYCKLKIPNSHKTVNILEELEKYKR
jgi:hypothetical protein